MAELVTTAAIHPNVIAGKAPTLSPYAPASPDDLDKQHELRQFPLLSRLFSPDIPHPVCGNPHPSLCASLSHPMGEGNLPLPQARDIIRCGEGDMASLFEIPRSEVHLLDAGAGAAGSRRS